MRIPRSIFSKKFITCSSAVLLTTTLFFACKKSDSIKMLAPAISYQQKVISIAEDVPMTAIKPDSTGGAITDYTINPLLPKGLFINTANGEISGTPSDTLAPAQYIVTAKGPGGTDTDTLTLLIGTVGFNYGSIGTFTLEVNSKDLVTNYISPIILAGNFNQFFCVPSPDSLAFKTGLTFNAKTGQISGTPGKLTTTTENPMPATFIITGITTANKAASATINIIVNDKKPNFTYPFSGSFSKDYSVGTVLTPSVSSISGSIKKYRLAPGSPALPAGLTLDSTLGKITGTPTVAGNVTIIVRGVNSGGYQDVSLPLVINASPAAPEVRYMMSWFSGGNVVDTLCPRILSGNTTYLTRTDNAGNMTVYLTPVAVAGQVGTFTNTGTLPAGMNFSNGAVSGTPSLSSVNAAGTYTIANAITGGPAGTYTTNFVVNDPFFKYNSNGKGLTNPNTYYFVQNQRIDEANGTAYPGYTATELAPVGGTGVTKYAIYPFNTFSQPFANTGLTFNTTTGAISGTPHSNTNNQSNFAFWDYVIVGSKLDGSFTYYKVRFKIYPNLTDWSK